MFRVAEIDSSGIERGLDCQDWIAGLMSFSLIFLDWKTGCWLSGQVGGRYQIDRLKCDDTIKSLLSLGASRPLSSAKIGDPGDRAVIHRIDNVHRPPGSSHTTAKKDRSN